MQTPDVSISIIPPAGEALGIIFPPSDIRGIVDKTAQFVAKNGPEFEQRVLSEQSNGQKFGFLLPGNPYRIYYDAKVKEYQTGEGSEVTQKQIPQAILERQKREAEKKQKREELLALTSYAVEPSAALASKADGKVSQALATLAIEDDKVPEPPPDDQYSVGHPYAASLDVDVIKLTAQYVARNGQKFLVGLGQRERGNPQFAFLRATHPLFAYFTSLVDAYSRCLTPDRPTITRLKDDVGLVGKASIKSQIADVKITDHLPLMTRDNYVALFNILQRVYERHRWEAYDEQQREEKEKREAEERESMQSLDWHDFSVVEVIEFTEDDDHLPLGAPMDKSVLLQPKPIAPLAATGPLSSVAADLQAAMGGKAFTLLKEETAIEAPTPPLLIHQQPPAEIPTPQPPAPTPTAAPLEVPGAPILVVKDYIRERKRHRKDTSMQKCPITGQMVPTHQMTEHLRIVLLDPKWKEQKDAVMEKAKKDSALADGADFGANLAEFVINRPDLFGSVEDEVESTYVPGPKRK